MAIFHIERLELGEINDALIMEAYLKGLRGVDPKTAARLEKQIALAAREGVLPPGVARLVIDRRVTNEEIYE